MNRNTGKTGNDVKSMLDVFRRQKLPTMVEDLAGQPLSPVKRPKYSLMETMEDVVSLADYSIFDEAAEPIVAEDETLLPTPPPTVCNVNPPLPTEPYPLNPILTAWQSKVDVSS